MIRFGPIPAGVDEKRLGANVGRHVDLTINAGLSLVIDYISAMIRFYIEDMFRRWAGKYVATDVIQKSLSHVVQIRLHAEDMSFRSFDRLASFEHSQDWVDRTGAHIEKQSCYVNRPVD